MASRKNGNRQPREIGDWGTLQNAPETWEVRDSQDSKGGTSHVKSDSREKVRDGVAIPQSQL